MNNRLRIYAAMAVIGLVSLFATAQRAAAGVPWACPGGTTVINNTTCAFTLSLRVGPVAAIVRVPVPAGPGAVVFVNTAGVTSIDFVYSWAGNPFPVLAPPPVAPCSCLATDWSTCCVEVSPGCCVDVCFAPAPACRITINPAACLPPGPCRV